MAVAKLHGTVGPGFTISLKDAHGKAVKTLKHGKYTFIVQDFGPWKRRRFNDACAAFGTAVTEEDGRFCAWC